MDSFVRQAPGKMRMEMSTAGQAVVIITREDTGVNYMLMPSMNMYREMDAKSMQEAGSSDLDFSEASEVGEETINGYNCTKYRAQFQDKQGGKGGGYYWVSDDGILMKVDMIYQSSGQKGQRMVLEMRDLEIGPQDPSEFEVPANYSSFGFGNIMKQFGGGQPGPGSQMPNAQEPPPDGAQDGTPPAEEEEQKGVLKNAGKSMRKGFGKLFKRD
jgi:hypothetical protein